MGKGDQRSRRGKLYRGTFGKSRPKTAQKAAPAPARRPAAAAPAPAPVAKKAPRKTGA